MSNHDHSPDLFLGGTFKRTTVDIASVRAKVWWKQPADIDTSEPNSEFRT